MKCLICESIKLNEILIVQKKTEKIYYQCEDCEFIFLSPELRLDQAKEKARYLKHENDVTDVGYQTFVKPLCSTIQSHVPSSAVGLDYGSGPAQQSAVSYLLGLEGYQMQSYDPFFHKANTLHNGSFDYIVVCEVAEHFFHPMAEFKKLKNLLKPNGLLFVMTALLSPLIDFQNWSYRRDETHVSFYSEKTFQVITNKYDYLSSQKVAENVMLLTSSNQKY